MNFQKDVKPTPLIYAFVIPGTFFIFFSLFGFFGELPIMLYVGIFFYFLYFVAIFYEKHVSDHLVLVNEPKKIRMYPGEEGELTFTLEQRGLLPIIGAKLIITYSQVIDVNRKTFENLDHTAVVEIPITLLSFDRKKIKIPFTAKQRGVCHIYSIRLNVPNILGLGTIYLTYGRKYKTEVIVYPLLKRVYGLEMMEPKRNGDHFSRNSIYEQPILPVGTRNYLAGDPFNRLHWKASAKLGQLQTKVVEKVNQLSWLLIINVGQYQSSKIEENLKHAAFICKYATEYNIPFEIFINIPSKTSVPFYHLPLGSGKNHYTNALETLARVNRYGLTMSYSAMLRYIDRANKPPYIIQIGECNDEDIMLFRRWRNQGHVVYQLNHTDQASLKPLNMDERGEMYGKIG